MGLAFEWTVKLGDLLTLGGGLFVAAGIFYKRGGVDAALQNTIATLGRDFGEMKEEMKIFSSAIRELAVQRTEINMLMKFFYDETKRKG